MQPEMSQLTGSASTLHTNYNAINLAYDETERPVSLTLACLGLGDNTLTGQYGVMPYQLRFKIYHIISSRKINKRKSNKSQLFSR